MIRGCGLGYGRELDIGGTFLVAKLTAFSHHHSGIDPPGLSVLLTILMRIELKDGYTSLLAVTGGQTKILDSRFIAAIGASIDPSAGHPLCKRIGVKESSANNTISHVCFLNSLLSWYPACELNTVQ
jgi:hypothetical protein